MCFVLISVRAGFHMLALTQAAHDAYDGSSPYRRLARARARNGDVGRCRHKRHGPVHWSTQCGGTSSVSFSARPQNPRAVIVRFGRKPRSSSLWAKLLAEPTISPACSAKAFQDAYNFVVAVQAVRSR